MWYLAIDFGTTASTAAFAHQGKVTGLQVNGQNRVPSAVLLDENGVLVAGSSATNQASLFPDRVERTPKESLGSSAPLLLGGHAIAVTSAVAEVLRQFVEEGVRQHQGEPPAKVVLTHPARWADARQQALVEAATEAGIASPELCPEPVGAAVHYAEDRVAPGAYVAVYDFGGGTFDTAVLRRTADGFERVGDAGGNDEIGGEDLDFRLYELVGEILEADDPDLWHQIAQSDEPRWRRANYDLQEQVRKAKEALSTWPTTRVPIPNSDRDVLLTREQFEALIDEDVRSTVTEMERTITAAGVEVRDIDLVFLAGGSSRIPMVQRLMTERFGNRVSTYADPKLVVSMGAARWLGERYGELTSGAVSVATPAPTGPAGTDAAAALAEVVAEVAADVPPTVPPPPVAPPAAAGTTGPAPIPPPPGPGYTTGPAPIPPPPGAGFATGPAPIPPPPGPGYTSGPAPIPPPPGAPPAAPPPAAAPPAAAPPAAAPPVVQPPFVQPPVHRAPPTVAPVGGAAANPKAQRALIAGLLSFALFVVAGVPAILWATQARQEIAASGGRQTGDSTAVAGLVLGVLGMLVWLGWAVLLLG